MGSMRGVATLVALACWCAGAGTGQEVGSVDGDVVITGDNVVFTTSDCAATDICAITSKVAGIDQQLNTGVQGAINALTQPGGTISNISAKVAVLEAANQRMSECAAQGLVFNLTSQACIRPSNLHLPASDSGAKCTRRSHAGNTEYSNERGVFRVCRVDAIGPHWVEVPLVDRREHVLNFNAPSVDHFAVVENVPTLPAFSITFWMKSTDTSAQSFVFSYASSAADNNAILIFVRPTVRLLLTSASFDTGTRSDIFDGNWHHIAITWTMANSGRATAYKDGGLLGQMTGVRPGQPIKGGGTIVIGQEQDRILGGFSSSQLFQGTLGRMNMYTRELTQQEVAMSLCNSLPEGDLKRFEDFASDLRGAAAALNIIPSDIPTVEANCPADFDLSFGSRSTASYTTAGSLPNDLTALSMVWWIRTNQRLDAAKSEIAALISYAVSNAANNEILVITKPGQVFIGNKNLPVPALDVTHDGQWHHVAITWGLSDTMVRVYIDGDKAFEAVSSTVAVKKGGNLLLGQEQDLVGGGFNNAQKFIGRVSQMNFYSRVLSVGEIRDIKCGAVIPGDLKTWPDFRASLTGPDVMVAPSFLPRSTLECPNDFDINFGQPDIKHYVEFDEMPDLTAFAASFWFQSTENRDRQFLFSYRVGTFDNAILFSTSNGYFTVLNKPHLTTAQNWHDSKWHFAVFQWSSAGGLEAFVDGQKIAALSSASNTYKGFTIAGSGSLILGQEQDQGGALDTNQRWNGRLHRLNLFSKALTPAEQQLAKCGGIDGDIAAWADLRSNIVGTDVTVEITRLDFEAECPAV